MPSPSVESSSSSSSSTSESSASAPRLSGLPRALRLVEFALIFIGVPVSLGLSPLVPQRHRMLVLWAVTALALGALLADRAFDRRRLWNSDDLRARLAPIIRRFLLLATVLAVLVAVLAPSLFLRFPRERPALWALVMLLYPVLSVYPQGLIYRAFLFHRYGPAMPGPAIALLASAAAFALMHVIFHNPVAPVLSFLGGLMFARTYARTGSMLVSSIEHAMYGCFIFTVGLGEYFYKVGGS